MATTSCKWAEYVGLLFVPWNDKTRPLRTFDEVTEKMNEYHCSDDSRLRCLAKVVENSTIVGSADSAKRFMLAEFRGRATPLWTEQEKADAKSAESAESRRRELLENDQTIQNILAAVTSPIANPELALATETAQLLLAAQGDVHHGNVVGYAENRPAIVIPTGGIGSLLKSIRDYDDSESDSEEIDGDPTLERDGAPQADADGELANHGTQFSQEQQLAYDRVRIWLSRLKMFRDDAPHNAPSGRPRCGTSRCALGPLLVLCGFFGCRRHPTHLVWLWSSFLLLVVVGVVAMVARSTSCPSRT